MLVVAKYILFQIPSWLLVGFLAYHARGWLGLDDWVAVLLVAAFVTKDAVLFPYVRRSYEIHSRENAEALIGRIGIAEETLDPEGYVRLGPELWKAELGGASSAPAGSAVRVRSVDGLTLRVEVAE